MDHTPLKPLPPWLEALRLGTLLALAGSIPLAGFLGVPIPGTSFHKKTATLAAFDLLIWIGLAVVVISRFLRSGGKGLPGLARTVFISRSPQICRLRGSPRPTSGSPRFPCRPTRRSPHGVRHTS